MFLNVHGVSIGPLGAHVGAGQGAYGDEVANFTGDILLPEETAGEELARKYDKNEYNEEEFQQSKAADLRLLRRVRLLGANLFATGEFLLAFLLALEPGLMFGFPALFELSITAALVLRK